MDFFTGLVADADAAAVAAGRLPPRAAVAREMQRLRREALRGSLAIAGNRLDAAGLDALLDRGIVLGDVPLADALAARDLAAAAAWVAESRPYPAGDPRPLLTVDEVRMLHRLTAREATPQAGIWRQTTLPARERVVATPPWMVPFETAALVERMRRAPGRNRAPWLAAFLARAARTRPFPSANGRVSRLAADLVLRRAGLPPLVVAPAAAPAYHAALAAATAGAPDALVAVVARALRDACARLVAAGEDAELVPLRTLAGADYAALVKAARRGRLRAIERGGRLLTTAAWIEAYRDARWRRER